LEKSGELFTPKTTNAPVKMNCGKQFFVDVSKFGLPIEDWGIKIRTGEQNF
jgi:hypothetical protein